MKTLTGAEKRQKARKRHSKEYCLKHASRKRLTPADLFHFAVAEKLKIIYCVTPKVASKTLVRVLEQAQSVTHAHIKSVGASSNAYK